MLVKAYYDKTKAQVRLDAEFSGLVLIGEDARQGGFLSPILFNSVIGDYTLRV